MKKWIGLIIVMSLPSIHAAAQSRRFNIQSKYDQFELKLSGGSGTVGGKKADLSSIRDLLPMLSNELDNECPKLRSADIKVKEGGKTHSLYVSQGIISDGEHCMDVAGDGLFYFPVHHDFLIGSKRSSIPLKSPVKIFRQGNKVLELRKKDDAWTADNSTILPDWGFLERWENSLNDYNIRLRVQEGIGKGKPKVLVQIGDQSYEFYKITGVLWAVKKPGTNWLEASDDWSFWYDLDNTVLEDHLTDAIHTVEDKTQPKEARDEAMEKLAGTWSRNLKVLYHKLLLTDGEAPELQKTAIQRLRSKPAPDTKEVMKAFAAKTTDEELKSMAEQVLKLWKH